MLERAGFRVSIREEEAVEPDGTVLDQDPRAGERIDTRTTVQLIVSAPGETSKVPDVRGMMRNEAEKRLAGSGFGVEVSYEPVTQEDKNRIVLSQIPEPGTKLQEEETVTIIVGDKTKKKD
jgi:serine/threonine-protein kinase